MYLAMGQKTEVKVHETMTRVLKRIPLPQIGAVFRDLSSSLLFKNRYFDKNWKEFKIMLLR